MAAISALLARPDVKPEAVAALGHSYGGNTTLFLTAVDERIRTGCASGALASYRHRISDGAGIEMAEVIPGFTTRFDMHHVLDAIAPRHFLVVSGTDDRYTADAQEVVDATIASGRRTRRQPNRLTPPSHWRTRPRCPALRGHHRLDRSVGDRLDVAHPATCPASGLAASRWAR